MSNQKKNEELVIPDKVSVFEDKKTGAKTLAMPFQFPDGKNGVVMVSRLHKSAWIPKNHISKVTIHYEDHPTT